ncbi:MAG: hypothetical protein JRI73_11510, partial [Deltaproteobacteria bacterium]|nr:hypothetical protein [Deltaproteobacteria bacterium]
MKSTCIVLTMMIGLISLCASCKSVNQQPPMTRSLTSTRAQQNVPPPTFNNNPQLDVILTNYRPILSVGNPVNMRKPYTLTFEISIDSQFPPDKTIRYENIMQQNPHISEKQVEPRHELKDGT